jgi:hypothetical protein
MVAPNTSNTGPNPGDTNTTATAQTPVVEVFGTPGDGKVPTWNAAAGRFEWGSGSAASTTTENVNSQASVSGSYTLPDVTADTIHRLTLTGNTTLTFPTAAAGKSFTVILVQDATGSRTVTWPTVKWSGAVVPTISTGGNKIDVFSFTCADGTNWLGFTAGLDMR